MVASLYGAGYQALLSGSINFATDTIKALITTSAYTPAPLTHDFKDDITNEVVGTGYTAGGVTLASKTITKTNADSWGTVRANSTAYAVGDVYRPASVNGFVYQCVAAGTSAASPPTFTTVVGDDFVDGTATFVCKGRVVIAFDFADPAWASSTITGRTVVIWKDTGTPATSPLIGYDSAAADVSSTNAPWTYQVAANGFLLFFMD